MGTSKMVSSKMDSLNSVMSSRTSCPSRHYQRVQAEERHTTGGTSGRISPHRAGRSPMGRSSVSDVTEESTSLLRFDAAEGVLPVQTR